MDSANGIVVGNQVMGFAVLRLEDDGEVMQHEGYPFVVAVTASLRSAQVVALACGVPCCIISARSGEHLGQCRDGCLGLSGKVAFETDIDD